MKYDVKYFAERHVETQTNESYHNSSLREYFCKNKKAKEEYIDFVMGEMSKKFENSFVVYDELLEELKKTDTIEFTHLTLEKLEEVKNPYGIDKILLASFSFCNISSFHFRLHAKESGRYYENGELQLANTPFCLEFSNQQRSLIENDFKITNEDDISRSIGKYFMHNIKYEKDMSDKFKKLSTILFKIQHLFLYDLKQTKLQMPHLIGHNFLNIKKESLELIEIEKDVSLWPIFERFYKNRADEINKNNKP